MREEKQQVDDLLDLILMTENIREAIKDVKENHGAPGIDEMPVESLMGYFALNESTVIRQILNKQYKPPAFMYDHAPHQFTTQEEMMRFLQKRETPGLPDAEWTKLGKSAEGYTSNQYFASHPEMVLADWVLSSFKKPELDELRIAAENACKAVEMMVQGNIDGAMSNYNS